MIMKELKKFLNQDKLVFLYHKYNCISNFCVGFLIVEAVTPEGRYDGYSLFLIENIERIA